MPAGRPIDPFDRQNRNRGAVNKPESDVPSSIVVDVPAAIVELHRHFMDTVNARVSINERDQLINIIPIALVQSSAVVSCGGQENRFNHATDNPSLAVRPREAPAAAYLVRHAQELRATRLSVS